MINASDTVARNDVRPTLVTRLIAWALAAKLDAQVAAGSIPVPGSPLAVHVMKLTSIWEREDIARSFLRLRQIGQQNPTLPPVIVSVLSHRIEECRELIDVITLRLHSPRPVRATGMARLRILLADGAGPLYFNESIGLEDELQYALAAL